MWEQVCQGKHFTIHFAQRKNQAVHIGHIITKRLKKKYIYVSNTFVKIREEIRKKKSFDFKLYAQEIVVFLEDFEEIRELLIASGQEQDLFFSNLIDQVGFCEKVNLEEFNKLEDENDFIMRKIEKMKTQCIQIIQKEMIVDIYSTNKEYYF